MTTNSVIEVNNLSKMYKLYDDPMDRLKETFHPFKKKYHQEFHALRDVNLSVAKGEVLGIVGKNGSGKSTLLQLITGVLTPTTGALRVDGKVSALLELGAGFNPELSGLENAYFKSSLLGNTESETDKKIDEIMAFADIGDFIHQPIKTYSSGMYVRLAFAVAINVEPDILIIDEALAVGDFRFKQKCLRKINQFREEGKTILFVSHDQGTVIKFCTRALWLLDGVVHKSGDPGDVCKDYMSYMAYGAGSGDERKTAPEVDTDDFEGCAGEIGRSNYVDWQDVGGCESFGTGGAKITKTCLAIKGDTERVDIFEGGERVVFSLQIEILEDIQSPIVGFVLCDAKGIHLIGMNSYALGVDLGRFEKGEIKKIEFEFDFPYLHVGNYAISAAVAEGTQDDNIQHHWVHDAYIVRIASIDTSAAIGSYFVIKDNFEIRVGEGQQ